MVVFESFVAASVTCFLAPIVSRPLSRNKSSKITVPLTDAKTTVISVMKTLRSVQATLDQQMRESLLDDCRHMDLLIDNLLKESNKKMNIMTKTRRYREMVREARGARHASLDLAFKVEEASLAAQMKESKKPEDMEAKAEEADIVYKERKFRYNMAKSNYQKLCGPGSESQRPVKLTLQLEVDIQLDDMRDAACLNLTKETQLL